jgi:hypothetical protein
VRGGKKEVSSPRSYSGQAVVSFFLRRPLRRRENGGNPDLRLGFVNTRGTVPGDGVLVVAPPLWGNKTPRLGLHFVAVLSGGIDEFVGLGGLRPLGAMLLLPLVCCFPFSVFLRAAVLASPAFPARPPAQVGACPPPMVHPLRQGLAACGERLMRRLQRDSGSQSACAGDSAASLLLFVLLSVPGGATTRSWAAADLGLQKIPQGCVCVFLFLRVFSVIGETTVLCLDVSGCSLLLSLLN